ncbi:MAG TPA: DUF1080 domain-containing protein [Gemmataceae bacterium]|jgi:hypothetical protein|nr:DUF1080 domain-containing protein [Gemmataceae bacterium]
MHIQQLSRRLAVGAIFLVISIPARAEEKPWLDLTASKDFSVWKGKVTDWAWAESVQMDEKNPKKLTAKAGTDILWNGEKGRAKDLVTKQSFGDVEIHVEFLIPKGSNSGVKFHAVYEIQILDSYGKKELTGDDCGGIYPRAEAKPKYHHIDKGIAPKVNACKPAGEWQTLDAIFLSPRFNADGKKTVNAKIVKAVLNGQVIHENQELLTPTGTNWEKPEVAAGPLLLQGDHGPVGFRNVRVREYAAGK